MIYLRTYLTGSKTKLKARETVSQSSMEMLVDLTETHSYLRIAKSADLILQVIEVTKGRREMLLGKILLVIAISTLVDNIVLYIPHTFYQ